MPGFTAATRSTDAEWMDTQAVEPADYAACLADLATVNTVTLARLPTLGFVAQAVRRAGPRPLRVLDVACGEGDMLRRLHRWGQRTGHPLVLAGLDLSAPGIDAARMATPAAMGIEYRVGDVFAAALGPVDVVISSLFTHHLSGPDIVRFMRRMEDEAAVGWFINDLHRNALAYHGFRALSSLAGWHRFVRHDGPVSVARSFRRGDWLDMLRAAGVAQARLRWHAPFRWCVGRLK